MDNLHKLGFSQWYREKIDSAKAAEYHIARVISVNKNSYVITNGKIEAFAEITGKLMFNSDSPLDYPAVGDWVYGQFFDDNSFAVIHEIIRRKSLLKRKTPGKKIEFQLIAANIDTALIVQSLDSNYNLRRLERYLVMIHEENIRPVVLLSKSDLSNPGEIRHKKSEIHQIAPEIEVTVFSNENKSGLSKVKKLLIPYQTFCLLGSSGVGKTTLLNNLMGEALFDTSPVREKDDRGRHITARRQLIRLKNDAMIIDTPGMRELGNFAVESGLENTFHEITALSGQCRYGNCTHTVEKGCAVLTALKEGNLSRGHYQNYIKMRKESAYQEMSYLEKRQKDKTFGKYVKSVMKEKKNKK